MTSPGLSWQARRAILDDLLPELAHVLHLQATDARLDGACHATSLSSNSSSSASSRSSATLQHSSKTTNHASASTNHTLDQARQLCLSEADFELEATLAQSGPCSRVQLVAASQPLVGHDHAQRQLYVIKTVDRKWAYRIRHQQSLHDEIKVLRLANRDRRRARTPRLVASFLSSEEFHIVSEQAVGGDLWSTLESVNSYDSPRGLPEPVVKAWIAQLVEALEWLHEAGFAHRDVKPHNLLLNERNHLLLTDFGSCAALSNTSAHLGKTRPTSIARKHCQALVGTPDYIAPEVLIHAEKLAKEAALAEQSLDQGAGGSCEQVTSFRIDQDERAYGVEVDWWSVGVVIYELLFGRAPFFAESIADTYRQIIRHKEHLSFPPNANISPSAHGLIKTLLTDARSRSRRAQTIKRHPWFVSVPWGYLDTCLVPLININDTNLTRTKQSFVVEQQVGDDQSQGRALFNFESAFLSSPGLSILRSVSKSFKEGGGQQHERVRDEDEYEFWMRGLSETDCCLTLVPEANEFVKRTKGSSGTRRIDDITNKSTKTFRARALENSFETPKRQTSRSSCSMTKDARSVGMRKGFTGTSSAARLRRRIDDLEAWIEMQDLAWEKGLYDANRVDSGRTTRTTLDQIPK
ncbi:hypothetical protein ACM66B_001319 [Microbotryomycetes sp. NB124-2]